MTESISPVITVEPCSWTVTVDGKYAGSVNDHSGKFYACAKNYGKNFATRDEGVAGVVAYYFNPDPDADLLASMAATLGTAEAARSALKAYRKAVQA